jgi:hypothetical protein
MYILVLIFITSTGGIAPSQQGIPFPSKDACGEAGPQYANYQSGVEAGKAAASGTKADEVRWYCLPVAPPKGPIT